MLLQLGTSMAQKLVKRDVEHIRLIATNGQFYKELFSKKCRVEFSSIYSVLDVASFTFYDHFHLFVH